MNIRLLLPPLFFISSLPWIYWLTNPLPWTPTFHCSPTLTLTFQLPAALNTTLGVSLFTFHYLYFVYIRLSPQPRSQLMLPLWLPGANISDKSESFHSLNSSVCLYLHTYLCMYVLKYTVGGLSQLCKLGHRRREEDSHFVCVCVSTRCQLTPSMSCPVSELNSCLCALFSRMEGPDVTVQCQPPTPSSTHLARQSQWHVAQVCPYCVYPV